MWGCEHEVDFAGTAVHRCAVDRIHPVLLYLAERLQRDWERTPCRFPKRTLLGVVLIFPVLAVSDHISGEVQQMKRLCKDCLHCKSQTDWRCDVPLLVRDHESGRSPVDGKTASQMPAQEW